MHIVWRRDMEITETDKRFLSHVKDYADQSRRSRAAAGKIQRRPEALLLADVLRHHLAAVLRALPVVPGIHPVLSWPGSGT